MEKTFSTDKLQKRKKQMIKYENMMIFLRIYNICINEIIEKNEQGKNYHIFEVPELSIIEYQYFNLNKCIFLLIKKLRKGNFTVVFRYPNLLLIAWNPLKINNKYSKKLVIENDKTNSLIKKMIQ